MKLLISALEPSANAHLKPLFDRLGSVECAGIFSPEFGEPLYDSALFSTMGFVGVISKIPLAQKALKAMTELAADCDCVLLIDSPAFNIHLAKAIKKRYPSKKIIYYILPQVWAWKAKRIPVVEAYTDIQAVILPFEKKWWKHGCYVGHPLMEEIAEFKESVATEEIYAFLPGSRAGEIERIFPVFREAAAALSGRKLLIVPRHFDDAKVAKLYGETSGFEIVREAHDAIRAAKFAFVCSGTATLETALIGTPFVLAYRAKPLDYMIATRFVKLSFAGLANLIFQNEGLPPMHPEKIQADCTAQALIDCAQTANAHEFLERSRQLRHLLSGREYHIADLIRRNS
ncbi:lipid-A-disaccharide synthase [Campylobacterota bacterium]|nr:lipid-A-disaccharide synthase [Campylobacterota bacterium]